MRGLRLGNLGEFDFIYCMITLTVIPLMGFHCICDYFPDVQDGPGDEPVFADVTPSVDLNGDRQKEENGRNVNENRRMKTRSKVGTLSQPSYVQIPQRVGTKTVEIFFHLLNFSISKLFSRHKTDF